MNMKQRLAQLEMKLAALDNASMLSKAAAAEQVAAESVQLMGDMIEQIVLIGESFNGLLAYINQISDDPMVVNELNAKMKGGGFGLFSDGNAVYKVVSDGK